MQGKIHSRQQEWVKEWGDRDEEGHCTEWGQAIGAPQREGPGMEVPSEKNLHQREREQDPVHGRGQDPHAPRTTRIVPLPGARPKPPKWGRS